MYELTQLDKEIIIEDSEWCFNAWYESIIDGGNMVVDCQIKKNSIIVYDTYIDEAQDHRKTDYRNIIETLNHQEQ